MKKLFLFLFVVACGLVSCEGPMGPEGPQGPQGYGTNWNVEEFTIYADDWKKIVSSDDPNDIYYRAVVVPRYPDVNNITDDIKWDIYDIGTVFAYMYRNYNTDNETQTLLPYVINWSNSYNETQAEVFYFDYTANDIAFYFARSGDNSENVVPNETRFRVVMNW